MSTTPVPLKELSRAVQSAVEQVLGKHNAVPIEKLWVGFVAPENIANLDVASKLATQLGKEAGVQAQPSLGQLSASTIEHGAHEAKAAAAPPHRIIGIVYAPK